MSEQSVRRLDARADDFAAKLDALLAWDTSEDASLTRTVRELIERVRAEGDGAVLELSRRFDGVAASALSELEVSQVELAAAYEAIGDAERDALTHAAERIRAYHARQKVGDWSFDDEHGNRLGQRVTPRSRRPVCAWRQGQLSFKRADDRDSRERRGRARDRR